MSKTMTKTARNKKRLRLPKKQLANASTEPSEEPVIKSRRLSLAVTTSDGTMVEYPLDGKDVMDLLDGSIPCIQFATRTSPGVRFVRLHAEGS